MGFDFVIAVPHHQNNAVGYSYMVRQGFTMADLPWLGVSFCVCHASDCPPIQGVTGTCDSCKKVAIVVIMYVIHHN